MIRNKALKRYNQFTPVRSMNMRDGRRSIISTDVRKFNNPDFSFETETN